MSIWTSDNITSFQQPTTNTLKNSTLENIVEEEREIAHDERFFYLLQCLPYYLYFLNFMYFFPMFSMWNNLDMLNQVFGLTLSLIQTLSDASAADSFLKTF